MKPTLPRAALAALLAATAILPARAQQPSAPGEQPPEQAALALKAATRYREATAALTQLAADTASAPGAGAREAALAETWMAMAVELWGQQPDNGQLAVSLAALRAGSLAQQVPSLHDRLGMLQLVHASRTDGSGIGALANELGLVREWWLLGAFDNERGKGHSRKLPAEQGFDPQARFDGKLRKVAWRQVPEVAVDGIVPLGEIVRPNDQVSCLLATAVHSAVAQPAALLLGTSGSFRVLLNGTAVGEREVERSFRPDQDAVALPLREGWNLLVLKVSHQEGGGYAAMARLRGIDGHALTGIRLSAARADLEAAGTVAAVAATEPMPAPHLGARTTLASRVLAGDAADMYRLAWLLHTADVDGEQGREDLEIAAAAADNLEGFAEAPFLLASTRVKQRASRADRDDNPRRADLERALAIAPDHVEAMLQLAAIDLESAGLAATARTRVEQALQVAPQSVVGRALLAETMLAQGQDALAWRVLRELPLADCPVDFLPRLAAIQADQDEDQSALATLLRLGAVSLAPDHQLRLVDRLLAAGSEQEAIERTRHLVGHAPLLRGPRRVLALHHAGHGRIDQALEAWSSWLAICPEDESALLECSALHRRNGDIDRQVETLRAALELNPNLRDQQRHLEYLVADQVPFHEAFRIDAATLAAADKGPPADAKEARDPLHHVLQQHVVKAHRNGTTTTYVRNVYRVLGEEGARRLERWTLPHYPGEQRARILACTVRKADGRIEKPRLSGSTVGLGGLAEGDLVDVEGRIDDLAPGFFGDYFGLEHWFPSNLGAPLALSTLTVTADAGREYRWQVRGGVPEPTVSTGSDGSTTWSWSVADQPRWIDEPRRPSPKESAPLVRISTHPDWDHFSAWWWNLIRNQIVMTPAMKEKVRELTAGAADDAQRIASVYDFVTNEIRYEAWEFGVHGYKPYSTDVIYERRHGDCKDKALLLCAMLGELGISASPVLIMAEELRSEDDLSLPLVNHFNHCIAWLPRGAEATGGFLDGTATLHPPDTVPEMDQGARVLVVDQGRAMLRDVPWATPETNADRETIRAELAQDGSARVVLEMAPTGNRGAELRNVLASEPARRAELVEDMLLQSFGKARVASQQASDVEQLAEPVTLTATFEAPEVARKQGGGLLLPGAIGKRSWVELASETERRHPLLLGAPNGDRQVIRWRLPPGTKAVAMPAPVTLDTKFATFRRTWRTEGDEVVVERELRLLAPRILPSDYAAFREFTAGVQEADAQQLQVVPAGGAR